MRIAGINGFMPTVYKQQSFLKTEVYHFARKAEILVNLGIDDSGIMKGWSEEQIKSTSKPPPAIL